MMRGGGWRSRLGAALVVLGATTAGALAQGYSPQGYPAPQPTYPQPQQSYPQSYPQGAQTNPACVRLEGQLATINRGGSDPARADQSRRMEEALARQQSDLDGLIARARRLGCESNPFLQLFSNQPAECRSLDPQIQNARAAVSRGQADLQRIQGGGDLEGQRQAVIAALAQNNCGPQYQAAARQQGGLLGGLFGSNPALPSPDGLQSSTFRTLCVRTCDGYYFPISFRTDPSRFQDDEQACQRLCPATEVRLFTHRNPGEEVGQAVSLAGQPYRGLAAAFKYRQSLDPACTCRAPGQSWADALGVQKDTTIERGDIVVTEERSKAMAQPRTDAQGKPIRQDRKPDPRTAGATSGPTETPADPGGGAVRTVGPTFMPATPGR